MLLHASDERAVSGYVAGSVPEAEVGAGAADDGARYRRHHQVRHRHVVLPHL